MSRKLPKNFDVVILGAGLAGLSLARQLLMQSGKKILLLEKWPRVPVSRQKVGEATVQVSGYYFSKILDLEEHLLRDHLMKYNLRFYWKTPGRKNDCYEDYSQCYIRNFSNIATYQLNRNKLEEELLRLNRGHSDFFVRCDISNLDVTFSGSGQPHVVRFESRGKKVDVHADWVIDTTGRAKFLSRRLRLTKASPIRHGSTFFWVDGLLNIEKLTEAGDRQRLVHKNRTKTGHLPIWLATNHFAGEGYWFWVIPLQGRTSLGLVYDKTKVPEDEVSSPEKAVAWICRQFPLFARELPKREIVDRGRFADYAYDCRQTISAQRWALSGEAGRFTDPLYSPGGDIIALYNTLITDAILTSDPSKLPLKTRIYERLMRAFYDAYVPSFTDSYAVLGDQECYAMKYAWELTIYFTFYVFPFINQVLAETGFAIAYLDLFAKLGPLNRSIQAFITEYYYWKKNQRAHAQEPQFFDFMWFEPLKKAEQLFYEIGLSGPECLKTLKAAMSKIETLARFIAVYIYSVVLGHEALITNKQLVDSVAIDDLRFDVESMRRQCSHLHPARDQRMWEAGSRFIEQFRNSTVKTQDNSRSQPPGSSAFSAAK